MATAIGAGANPVTMGLNDPWDVQSISYRILARNNTSAPVEVGIHYMKAIVSMSDTLNDPYYNYRDPANGFQYTMGQLGIGAGYWPFTIADTIGTPFRTAYKVISSKTIKLNSGRSFGLFKKFKNYQIKGEQYLDDQIDQIPNHTYNWLITVKGTVGANTASAVSSSLGPAGLSFVGSIRTVVRNTSDRMTDVRMAYAGYAFPTTASTMYLTPSVTPAAPVTTY